MKKFNRKTIFFERAKLIKCFLSFILLASTPVLAYSSSPGSQYMQIKEEAKTISDVVKQIETSTNYTFFYTDDLIDLKKEVNISKKNVPIENLLNQTFAGTGYSWKIAGKQIVISPSAETAASRASSNQAKALNQTQKIQISGVIKDANGDPIIGAGVAEEGTTNGTATDLDGKFTLNVNPGAKIKVSYIGYNAQEFIADPSKTEIEIKLIEDNKLLEEVVVVGYGVQKKVNMTGSVATIDSKTLSNRPIQNVSSGIQGLMPGVTVMSGQGRPGQDGSTIRVRGVGTMNTAGPYILIDGVESGTMNAVDPNDIESISVLKDAASAAIYGSKASNGVILITTKRGKSGKAKVSYNGYASIQNATNLVERLGSAEYAEMYNYALTADGGKAKFSEEDIAKFRDGSSPYTHPNTDWYDLAFRTGFQHQHNFSISGGAENASYMASVGLLSQDGILPNSERFQFNARTNLDVQLSKRLKVRLNMAFINNDYKDPDASYAGGSSDQLIRQLNIIAPWIPYKNEDGSYGTVSDGNPIAWLDVNQTVDRYNQNFTGALAADYTIMDGLVATLQGAYVTNTQHYKNFRKFIQYNPNKASDPNQLDERYYLWNRVNFDALLNYDKSFGAHNFKALAGWHTEKYDYQENRSSRKKFPNNSLDDMNAGDASTQTNSGFTRELAMISWFGRINYDYASKYLFEANIRADAASRFADGNRWGYFPSFSGAWRLSEEAFMENSKEWLNNLKIRASWGILGNQDALDDYYPYLNTYNISGNYPFNGSIIPGYYQGSYKQRTISWEESRTWGVGVDLSVINKINLALDYYDRKTTGIIMDVPVPTEFGLGAYKDNVGALSNRGIELSLGYNDKWGDWTFEFNSNFAYNKNKVLDLGGVDILQDPNNSNIYRRLGRAFDAYYVYKADGFFKSDEEAQAYMNQYSGKEGYPFVRAFKGGDLIYKDTNGDGAITADDRVTTNSTTPKFTFGWNINVGWKNFDLSMIFSGASGVARIYSAEAYGDFRGDSSHPATIWRDSWTYKPNSAKMPRIYNATNSNSHPSNFMSTFWVQNTSFVRLKNLQLGYTLPKNILNAMKISNLRIFYTTENLLSFDSMPINLDPEATSERASSFPLVKTHAIGVSLSF